MATFLYRLGHFSVRRRRFVLLAWVLLFIAAGAASAAAGGTTNETLSLPGTETQQATELLGERLPAASGAMTQVVFVAPEGAGIADADVAATIDAAMAEVMQVEGVSVAMGPSLTQRISEDGTVGLGSVIYDGSAFEVTEETTHGVVTALGSATDASIQVEYSGEVVPGVELEPPSSELIGLGVAVIVLLLSFGSVLAMGLPILTALLGLGIGVSGIGLLSAFVDLSSTAPTLAIMIGLAVGIDYALFVVTRHRQNLATGLDVEEAAARANATAGGAVVFAGVTVIIAISALAVIGIPFLTVMGLAAAATVTIAVLVAITLLPAMLGFVGMNIDRFRVPGLPNRTGGVDEGATLGSRWAAAVTNRPYLSLVAGMAVMALLAIPVASMRLGLPDEGNEPEGTTQRAAYDITTEAFGPGYNGQLRLLVDLEGVGDQQAVVDLLAAALEEVEGTAGFEVVPAVEGSDLAMISIIPAFGPAAPETEKLVHDLRGDFRDRIEEETGSTFLVAGSTSANIDISEKVAGALVPFMVIVIGLTVVLLTAVFRSLVVPIKAALAILVSIGSAFGVIVAVFNWGWLGGLIGVDQTMPIVSFVPMMMFAILFGLSMDYEVFILSRIHEEYHRTGDAKRSVLTGLTSSARVITAAAAIMISVFGAFALGDSPIIKMFGVGLATAVFLDATVVRMVIVPAVMTLFGDRAWVLPSWLDRILPNLDVEGEALVERLEAKDAELAERKRAESRQSVGV